VLLLLTGAALFFSPIVGASERAATVELLRDGMKKLRPA
jgi:hypothetical protein